MSDLFCCRPGVCNRAGEDVQVLLSEAQNESHRLLPRRRDCSADRMAHPRRDPRVLWLLSFIQVFLQDQKALIKANYASTELVALS